jgi:hypothetical protein
VEAAQDSFNASIGILFDSAGPEVQHAPTEGPKLPVIPSITAPVGRYFVAPWTRQPVFPTTEMPTMPEIAVDENNKLVYD